MRFLRRPFLFIWNFFINKRDEKIPHDYILEQHIQDYRYFHKLSKQYHRKIVKTKFKRTIKYHKIVFFKTTILLCMVGTAAYFIYKNYNPKIIWKNNTEQFAAKIKPDSTVVIDYVVNPKLKSYLTYIAATETPIINGDTLASYRVKSYDPNSTAMGRYQMTKATRIGVGLGGVSDEVFLNWPELQDIACYRLLKINYESMRKFIKEYDGQIINGFYITEPGLLSLAHALGAGGAMSWVRNGCRLNDLPPGAPNAYKRLTFQKYIIKFNQK